MFDEFSLNPSAKKILYSTLVFLLVVLAWNTVSQGNALDFQGFPKGSGPSSHTSVQQTCNADRPVIQTEGSCRIDGNQPTDAESFSSTQSQIGKSVFNNTPLSVTQFVSG